MSGIADFIDQIEAVDSHAHVGLWDDRQADQALRHEDLRLLFPRGMLLSVTSPEEQIAMGADAELEAPYRPKLQEWADARGSCYYELLQDRAYRDLYGSGDIAKLVDSQRNTSMVELYDDCIRRAGLSAVMVNVPEWPAAYSKYPRLRWVPYLDQFIYAGHNDREKAQGGLHTGTIGLYEGALQETLHAAGRSIDQMNLTEVLELAEVTIRQWHTDGVGAGKINCAYVRSLTFDDVPLTDAQQIWDTPAYLRTQAESKALQDHLARFVVKACADSDLPIQIHAAVGDAPGLLWTNASPVNLEPIFADPALGRPKVIVLHGGFPANNLVGWYAATYANVYVDYSWLPMLSDVVLDRCLDEWLDYVPHNKILFGTDAWSPELFYAGTRAARDVLAGVLERRIADHRYTPALAEKVADAILAANSRSLYRVDE